MDASELDRIFRALADPVRRKIIDSLGRRPGQSLFEICALTSAEGGKAISRQAISQHLDMLGKAGLLRVSWSGRTKLHELDLDPLQRAADAWLYDHLTKGNDQ